MSHFTKPGEVCGLSLKEHFQLLYFFFHFYLVIWFFFLLFSLLWMIYNHIKEKSFICSVCENLEFKRLFFLTHCYFCWVKVIFFYLFTMTAWGSKTVWFTYKYVKMFTNDKSWYDLTCFGSKTIFSLVEVVSISCFCVEESCSDLENQDPLAQWLDVILLFPVMNSITVGYIKGKVLFCSLFRCWYSSWPYIKHNY